MSSNIRITRICQYCCKEFIAKTTVTKCCSDYCAKRLYKQKQKEIKIQKSDSETSLTKNEFVDIIKSKEFLTVRDMSRLLSCSIRTAYDLIAKGKIKAVNLSERKTLIKRSEIDKLFK